ncbi:MAG: glycosyltransferase, partial [Nitrosospira sp.]
CGTYRYGFAQVGDFDMWIRICLKYEIHVLQEKLIRFRVRNNEANTSGSRPETRIRGVTEFYQVFANYLRLDSFEEFVAVFPGAKQFYRKNGFVPGFVLAMLSLEPNALHMAKTYASISLFNLLWDDKTSGKIKELYNFDYRDLIELTGKHDIFSQEAVANLGKMVTEQNEQIVNLNQTVIEYNSRIARLQHQIEYQTAEIHASTSWRLTRPIRSIKSILITLGIHAKQGPLTGIMRFAGFNNLLRRVYRNLPLPLIVKQRLEKIYLRQFGASNQADIINENTFQFEKNHEFLPLIAVSAKQFDPSDPWVLVVDLRTPTPDQDSGSVRMSAIIRLLREMEFRITFISDSEEYLPHYQETLEEQGIDVLRGFNAARRHLADAGGKYHFVLLSRPEVAFQYLPYVRAYALYATIIYDTVDLHWIRFEREMQVSGDRSLLDVIAHFRRMELFNTACADLVLAITNEERNRLLIEQPDAKITILPNIHEPYPPKMSFDQRKGLLFIGSFWHKPNEDAVIYFVRDILPKIIEEIPDLVFYIIGSNMPATVRALRSANVEPLGFVANVAPYFESCRIFVAPLRFGAGMKGKVGQSMSHGLPVITTQIGAEGMGLHHGKHVLVATGPQDFADSVVRLYGNKLLWRNLSTESLVYLKANYSLAANRKQMVEIFGRTQNKSRLTGHQEAGMAITTCQ